MSTAARRINDPPLRLTLSCPDHPICREMTSALSGAVTYDIVGPRFREAPPPSRQGSAAGRIAYRAALMARRSAAGAIAYQRAKSALLLRSAPRAQLVHCCGHLAYGSPPWIGDYENVNVLGFYSPRLLRSRLYADYLRRAFARPECRAIRVWSHSAKQSFEALFTDRRVRDKLRVVYPALAPPELPARRGGTGPPRVLFIGRGFYVKGGHIFLAAIAELREHLNFRVDFICDLPPEHRASRSALADTVSFYEPVFSRDELYSRFYANADVFVMLGMADSYGLALLEASAFALPVVAFRLNSGLTDLLRLTRNALLIEPAHQVFGADGVHDLEVQELLRRVCNEDHQQVVREVAEALARLLGDAALRSDLGERGRAAFAAGPLSIPFMRQAMLDLYESVRD